MEWFYCFFYIVLCGIQCRGEMTASNGSRVITIKNDTSLSDGLFVNQTVNKAGLTRDELIKNATSKLLSFPVSNSTKSSQFLRNPFRKLIDEIFGRNEHNRNERSFEQINTLRRLPKMDPRSLNSHNSFYSIPRVFHLRGRDLLNYNLEPNQLFNTQMPLINNKVTQSQIPYQGALPLHDNKLPGRNTITKPVQNGNTNLGNEIMGNLFQKKSNSYPFPYDVSLWTHKILDTLENYVGNIILRSILDESMQTLFKDKDNCQSNSRNHLNRDLSAELLASLIPLFEQSNYINRFKGKKDYNGDSNRLYPHANLKKFNKLSAMEGNFGNRNDLRNNHEPSNLPNFYYNHKLPSINDVLDWGRESLREQNDYVPKNNNKQIKSKLDRRSQLKKDKMNDYYDTNNRNFLSGKDKEYGLVQNGINKRLDEDLVNPFIIFGEKRRSKGENLNNNKVGDPNVYTFDDPLQAPRFPAVENEVGSNTLKNEIYRPLFPNYDKENPRFMPQSVLENFNPLFRNNDDHSRFMSQRVLENLNPRFHGKKFNGYDDLGYNTIWKNMMKREVKNSMGGPEKMNVNRKTSHRMKPYWNKLRKNQEEGGGLEGRVRDNDITGNKRQACNMTDLGEKKIVTNELADCNPTTVQCTTEDSKTDGVKKIDKYEISEFQLKLSTAECPSDRPNVGADNSLTTIDGKEPPCLAEVPCTSSTCSTTTECTKACEAFPNCLTPILPAPSDSGKDDDVDNGGR